MTPAERETISLRTFDLWCAVARTRGDDWGIVLASIEQTDDAMRASAAETARGNA